MAINENISKKDLDLILSVNRKAIEIESEVVEQNEEIIGSLTNVSKILEEHIKSDDKFQEGLSTNISQIKKDIDEVKKDLFKIQVLFITGLLTLVAQIVQIFLKK